MEVRRKLMLKSLITKVIHGLVFLARSRGGAYYYNYPAINSIDDEDDEIESGATSSSSSLPEDVREGHFVVIAVDGEEKKRFIVELEYLRDPAFLRLLEKASEEYGFGQKGALAVPCTPQQLQRIIEKKTRVNTMSLPEN